MQPSAPTPQFRPLHAADLPAALDVCLEGMHDNPTHVRIFGSNHALRTRRLRQFFKPLLRYTLRRGHMHGLWLDTRLVGIFGMLRPGYCRPRGLDILRLAPALVGNGNPACTWRICRWLWAWHQHDPDTSHWHLGPLVILPAYQGQGLGQKLIRHVQDHVDFAAIPGWLETDKRSNVRLYERYGFTVVKVQHVLGITHWFMQGRL